MRENEDFTDIIICILEMEYPETFPIENLPLENIIGVVENLDFPTIRNLCGTSKDFSQLCRDNRLWKYLLERDYHKVYTGNDARRVYLTYNEILYQFNYFAIITQHALDIIFDYFPMNTWQAIKDTYEDDPSLAEDGILDLNSLIPFVLETNYRLFGNHTDPTLFGNVISILNAELNKNIGLKEGDDLDKECSRLLRNAKKPYFVYSEGTSYLLDYDFDVIRDLIQRLEDYIYNTRIRPKCTDEVTKISHMLYRAVGIYE